MRGAVVCLGLALGLAMLLPVSLVCAAGGGRSSVEPARVREARRFLERRGMSSAHVKTRSKSRPGRAVIPAIKTSNVISPDVSGGVVWTATGPVGVNSASFGLVTGRVSSVAFDPSDATGNHVFVGTTGGGLWGSINAAASAPGSVVFTPLTDRLGALTGVPQSGISVGAVTVQPGATGVVLAGLGDPNDALDSYYGAGLLRSTDGGQTWSLIEQTVDFEQGLSVQNYSFVGEGFAGFAWSTANVQLVVAAVSQAYEGTLVNAGVSSVSGGNTASYEGLYYSNDGGATWHLATIRDANGVDVQGPSDVFTEPDGNAATGVVWNPIRQVFVAAVRYHGYYQSSDGVTWTRMADYPNGQPGTGLTSLHCPTEPSEPGVAGCPIFRGSLAVNPQTGDTFAWSVDEFNQDQGIWQDQCGFTQGAGGGSCANQTMTFGVQLNTAALETDPADGDLTIANGDYNLGLAAVPSLQDTLLFAGGNDLWKCSIAAGCVWRNTTNALTCASAGVGEYEHAIAWDAGNALLMFLGTDSGLWRSMDDVGETGSVCASTDASHVQNLNASLGSLTEVESLAQSGATPATMLAGIGANGFAGVVNAPTTAGDWNAVLGGEGGVVAIDQTSHVNSWFANAASGVAIYHCNSSSPCTPAGFGNTAGPVIGETQVANDGLTMPYPADFRMDAADDTQLLVGTCRVWRGPASGVGWTSANAISPVLDGTGGGGANGSCEGNALIRSIAALVIPGGGEVIYVGMAGVEDGGGIIPGHVFTATVSATGVVGAWTDVALNPVSNDPPGFNVFGMDVSSLYVDPHDATGGTVYATLEGFSSAQVQVQQLYVSTTGGLQWRAITGNLSNAPANAVVVDPQDANTVYVGTDLGVFVTRAVGTCGAGTTCWAPYGTGLPEAPVTELLVTPTTATAPVLTAGTYGRGVWQIPLATAGAPVTTAVASPSSLTFGSVTVGATSAAQSVTLKNTGTAALTVASVGFTGADVVDFGETDTCTGQVLAASASCVVKVSFTPAAAGARSGALTIEGNVVGGEVLVPVSGTGLATASVTLLPATLSFGTVQVGTTAATQVVNVQNVGGSTVTISGITVSAPFTKAGNTCGSSLGAGVACAVTVGFAPTVAGPVTGSLVVTDGVGSQSASLSGTGITGPTDTLSTNSLSFPNTVMAQVSAPLAVQITNTGGLPLTGIGTSVTGAQGAEFTAVSNCGSTLAAGGTCAVSVTFAPTVAGVAGASLLISDELRSQTVKLGGTGLKPPVITLNASAMNFGSVELNVASAAKTLTIANTGGSPLANAGFTFTGSGSASFSAGATTCGASLANGSSCTVQVIFTPQATGAATATMTVGTSSPGVVPGTVALSGTGLLPPIIEVSPAVLNMGSVVVGNSTDAFTVQVTNAGQITMNRPTFAVSGANGGDFALQTPTDIQACSGTLAPGAMCNIQVIFSPTVAAVESASLTVTGSNAMPTTATVSLMGTGTPLILLQANPGSLSFAQTVVGTTSAPLEFTISNLGRQTANGLALTMAGPYQLVPSLTTCKTKLTAVSSCVVGVEFAPTMSGDSPGTMTATVTNNAVSPLIVPLDGSGVSVGGIALSPTQVTFGSAVVGSTSPAQVVTITNSGGGALSGLTVSVSGTVAGGFALSSNECGGTLTAGASCTAGVEFAPEATGNMTGTLTVSSTSTGVVPGTVGLIGNGIPAGELSASPTVASFGGVTVGQTGLAQVVTLTNAGSTTLAGLQFLVAGDYGLPQNNCGTQIAGGASCSLSANFSPSQVGTRIGAVTVTSTNSGFVPLVVGLTGTGLAAAQLAVSPTSLVFGSVAVGLNSQALQLTMSNGGTAALTGLQVVATGPFSAGSGTCGTSLGAGSTCSVPVIFAPVSSGSLAGVVTVSGTNPGVPALAVPASGTGVLPAALKMVPNSLNFSGTTVGTTSVAQTVTVSDTGGLGLTGLVLNTTGDFAVASTSCAGTLAAGGACSAQVTFTPSVSGGRQGFLTATSATTGVANGVVSLTGTGLGAAVLTINPAQLTFGSTLLGQVSAAQAVTVTNSGQSGITDLSLYVTPGFQLVSTSCTTALPAGASCTAGIAFAPVAAGVITVSGALTASSALAAKAGTAPATAALSGVTAFLPGIGTMPEAVVLFGTTGVGSSAQPVPVTVTNTGTLTALTGLTLAVDTAGTQNGFGLSGNTCGATLAAGASCTVSVTFSPTIAGGLTGNLVLTSTNGANSAKLALGGIGFDFQMTVIGSASATVVQGQTGYYTLSVTPLGGTAGAFTFACGALPANGLCVFNPGVLQGLPANVSGNVSLGIGTGAPGGTGIAVTSKERPRWAARAVLACGLLVVPLAWRRRRSLLLVVLFAAMVCGVSSCAGAGGSGGSGGNLHQGGGTPTGSYPVVVTASAEGVAHSFTLTLVVN